MPDEKEKLLKLVNTSGFPFQLRVADQIRRQDPFLGWQLHAQEHPWCAEDGSEGFIDIIIRNRRENDRMVLECKRTRDADWVFLLPENGNSNSGTRARMLYVTTSSEATTGPLRIDWHDFYSQPDSVISEFCIVRGSGEGQKPMLENLCRRLLNSIECLAQEETSFAIERKADLSCLYVPVIVTNANLQVCRFKSSSTSLDDGEILDGDFHSVPYIRFCKSLTTKPVSFAPSISEANRERERTVFVVQSARLVTFLEAWYMTNDRSNERPFL